MTEFPVMNVLQVQTIPLLFTKSLKGKTFPKKNYSSCSTAQMVHGIIRLTPTKHRKK